MGVDIILTMLLVVTVGFLMFRARRVHQRLARLEQQNRYEIPPARRLAIENSILAIMYRDGKHDRCAGVAFFVSPTVAITVEHALNKRAKRVTCVRPADNARLVFEVLSRNPELDFAVLRLVSGQPVSPHHLPIPRRVELNGDPGLKDDDVFLVSCNISTAEGIPGVKSLGLSWHLARFIRSHANHFVYHCRAFSGETDGSIVVARGTGDLVGFHRELVNQAREQIEHTERANRRLTDVQASVKSLINGKTLGGFIGIRADAEELKRLLPP
jgi:hypothetical protein